MNLNDEELQKRIESGEAAATEDELTYQLLFRSLTKAPGTELSPRFADKVIARALEQNKQKESGRDWWWLGAGIFSLVVCLMIAFAFSAAQSVRLDALKDLWEYRNIGVAALVLVLVFNWLDKKLVAPKFDA